MTISIPKLILPRKTPRNTKNQLQTIANQTPINLKEKVRELTISELSSRNKAEDIYKFQIQ